MLRPARRSTGSHARSAAAAAGAALALAAGAARAQDALAVGQASLDPPTVVALGMQLLISGDDDLDASVAVRYRESGASAWRDALPLFRVHPEDSPSVALPAQFAGSIVDLAPETTYEIELVATDPDGGDQTVALTGATRRVPPADPASPSMKPVSDAAGLQSALDAALPGDVIVLADGVYAGNFTIDASGTAQDPIVIRGASRDGTVLDGEGCSGCNVLEVYGSYVHVERLTIRNASRAIRFQGEGAEGNVLRRARITGVTLGVGSRLDQKNFYICDNLLEGPLAWPAIYSDDGGAHANDDGIVVQGEGHVVCHNDLIGFGDALKMGQDLGRANDFYGNEVRSAYDNGFEFDGALRNVRAFRNRFTNTYSTISFQPVHGGPVYAFRNVSVNVVDEQLKFHGLGVNPPQEPNGALVLHNTFVSPSIALIVQTTAASHNFALHNNIFIGPTPPQGRVVNWDGVIEAGVFDYNGYSPDGPFTFHPEGGTEDYGSLAEAQAAGWEVHGLILSGGVFASGLMPPADYTEALAPADAALASSSPAIDRGVALPNIGDGYQGAAPDLGALELGCPAPVYGIRPEGMDESNTPAGCGNGGGGGSGLGGAGGAGGAGAGSGSGSGGSNGNGADGGADEGGCGCRIAGAGPRGSLTLLGAALAFALRWARRGRRI